MLQFANQFSFLLAGTFVLGLAGILLRRHQHGLHRREIGILLLVAGIIGLGWLAFKPRNLTSLSSQQVRGQIGQGKPVLIEFQSPY